MGICASCLGQNRHHPSQNVDEYDPLLDDSGHVSYGALTEEQEPEPDEEDLRREREALDQISTRAQEDMIDVLHQNTSEINHHLTMIKASSGCQVYMDDTTRSGQSEEQLDAQDAAWLDTIRAIEAENLHSIKGTSTGHLVMDLARLRDHNATLVKKPFRR